MAVSNSAFKKWLNDALNSEPEYPYVHRVKITPDIRVDVYNKQSFPLTVVLLAKDSLSIAFGEYECNLSGKSVEEIEKIVEEFYNDAKEYGIDQAIEMNISLFS